MSDLHVIEPESTSNGVPCVRRTIGQTHPGKRGERGTWTGVKDKKCLSQAWASSAGCLLCGLGSLIFLQTLFNSIELASVSSTLECLLRLVQEDRSHSNRIRSRVGNPLVGLDEKRIEIGKTSQETKCILG